MIKIKDLSQENYTQLINLIERLTKMGIEQKEFNFTFKLESNLIYAISKNERFIIAPNGDETFLIKQPLIEGKIATSGYDLTLTTCNNKTYLNYNNIDKIVSKLDYLKELHLTFTENELDIHFVGKDEGYTQKININIIEKTMTLDRFFKMYSTNSNDTTYITVFNKEIIYQAMIFQDIKNKSGFHILTNFKPNIYKNFHSLEESKIFCFRLFTEL